MREALHVSGRVGEGVVCEEKGEKEKRDKSKLKRRREGGTC
jgi:hypothetical protein